MHPEGRKYVLIAGVLALVSLWIWDVATWQSQAILRGHRAEILCLAFAPDGRTLVTGEAVNTWQPGGLFDALVVTGAVSDIPPRWLTWLKPGGRALIVRGQSPVQQATLLTHEGAGRYREEILFETDLPYLTHAEPPQRFVF